MVFLVVFSTLFYVLNVSSQNCDLPSLTACSGSHVYANDNGNYSIGDGGGNTFRCITIGPNFNGSLSMNQSAQNVDNYLCIETGASASLGGNYRPRLTIINHGTFNQDSNVPYNGPNNIENYGVYNINSNNVSFSLNWSIYNYSGGQINTTSSGPDLEFAGSYIENSGVFNVQKGLNLNNGAIFDSDGTIDVDGNLTLGSNFVELNLTGGTLDVDGNVNMGSSTKMTTSLSTVTTTGFLNSNNLAELYFDESEVSFGGNVSLGYQAVMEVVSSNVIIDGNFSPSSSEGELIIDLSTVTVNGNVIMAWNWAIIFNNCGLLDISGNLTTNANINVISGPAFPTALVITGGNINLTNSSSVDGYADLCAGGSINIVGTQGPNVTECEYEVQGQVGFPFSCNEIVLGAEFLTFTATYQSEKGAVELEWMADEDGQDLTYEVQWGGSGQEFVTIDTIYSSGKWNTVLHKFKHPNVPKGTWFYRIVSTNEHGKQTVTPIRVVNVDSYRFDEEPPFHFYPNPVRSILNLEVDTERATSLSSMPYLIQILSSDGKVVKQLRVHGEGRQLVQIDVRDLPVGIYILRWSDFAEQFVKSE